MFRKLVAIALAVLINCAVLAWFHNWSIAAVASAAQSQRTDKALTLPTITVRPTRAQIDMLRREAMLPKTSSVLPTGDGGMQALVMPYYSFADTVVAARKG